MLSILLTKAIPYTSGLCIGDTTRLIYNWWETRLFRSSRDAFIRDMSRDREGHESGDYVYSWLMHERHDLWQHRPRVGGRTCLQWMSRDREGHESGDYGVVSISRFLKIIGLFCKRAFSKSRYSAKETYNFKEPVSWSRGPWVGGLCILLTYAWETWLDSFIRGGENTTLDQEGHESGDDIYSCRHYLFTRDMTHSLEISRYYSYVRDRRNSLETWLDSFIRDMSLMNASRLMSLTNEACRYVSNEWVMTHSLETSNEGVYSRETWLIR